MSNPITNLCRPLKLTPPQKCVLMALADRANDAGQAWPSIAWLGEWTCYGRTAVIQALKGLESLGLITMTRSTGKNNQCQMNLDRVAELSSPRASTSPTDEELEGTDQCATRTSPPGELVRQTDTHPFASRTTTRSPGVPTRPPDGPDTSLNINKTSKKTREKRVAAPAQLELLEVAGVSPELLADYMAVRKAKKAGPFTATALSGMKREADKAGLTMAQALTVCCEAGWQGFNATWYARRNGDPRVGAQPATPAPRLPEDVQAQLAALPANWYELAGFETKHDANGSGCHWMNYTEFRNRERIVPKKGVPA